MAIEFQLPELGENVEGGDVVNVLVQEGETIAGNTGVIELETDKAVVEIPCPHAGRVSKLLVKKGQTVKVGQTVLTIEPENGSATETTAEAVSVAASAAATSAPTAPAKQTATTAQSGAAGQGIAAAPAEASVPARSAPVSAPAAPVAESAAAVAARPPLSSAGAGDDDAIIPAGPAVRRLARELGVDLRSLSGSGPHGRITPEDVQAAAAAPSRAKAPGVAAAPAAQPYQPVVPAGESGRDNYGPVIRERMPKIRQTIAAQMVKSATTIPHVTNFDDADVTELDSLRRGVPQGFLPEGVKLTLMPFVVRACALALRRHPIINSSIDEETQSIVYKQYVNMGIAVDTPRGLVVPVMRDADRLSIVQIAGQLGQIVARARAAQFAVEELRGGTFTISNLGAVGGTYSTPIINHPETAILLLGRSRMLPVVREGRIEPRLMLPLSFSYDHRVIDGAAAARFLGEVIDWLQSPAKLLLV